MKRKTTPNFNYLPIS